MSKPHGRRGRSGERRPPVHHNVTVYRDAAVEEQREAAEHDAWKASRDARLGKTDDKEAKAAAEAAAAADKAAAKAAEKAQAAADKAAAKAAKAAEEAAAKAAEEAAAKAAEEAQPKGPEVDMTNSRDELDDAAYLAGVEDPEKLPNKQAVLDALRAALAGG